MTKHELTNKIASRIGMPRVHVKPVVKLVLDCLVDAIAREGNVELRGFGVFTVKTRKARPARNPMTGAPVMVPERKVVCFKPGKDMVERIVKPSNSETPTVLPSEPV